MAPLAKLSLYRRIQSASSASPTASILRRFNDNVLSEGDGTHSERGSKGFKGCGGVDLNPELTTLGWYGSRDDENSDKQSNKPLKMADDKVLGIRSQTASYRVSMEHGKVTPGFAMSGLHRGLVVGGRASGLTSNISVRYVSTIGEVSDKVDTIPEYINDVAQVLGENSISVDTMNTTQAVSEVAAAAADCSYPVAALQYAIEAVHVHSGLPWWASIIGTTLIIRTLSIPILISQLKATCRLTLMRPQLEEVTEQMKECVDPKSIDEGRRRVQNLFKQYNVTPFTPMKGILIQGPVFISFYLAITNMAANVPSFKEGGALWFRDLSTPDSLYLLPALTALSFLATVELNMQEGLEGNPMANKMKMFSRFIALITVPITMNFPKAIFCYWITSNLFSLVHGAVIKMPGVKRALAIPEIPVPPKAPTTLAGSITTTEKGPPSSSLVHQRLRALERTVKARRNSRKR